MTDKEDAAVAAEKKAESDNEAKEAAAAKKKKNVTTKTVTYDKDAEYDWASMSEAELRAIYPLIQAACPTKVADIPSGASEAEVRETCKNTHNFIRVRSTEAKFQNQQTKAKKAKATDEENEDMATKKKSAKKSAARGKVTGKTTATTGGDKFAGYPLTARVTVLNKTNPAREGNAKWKRWNAVLAGGHKTVADLKKAKANPQTVRNAVKAKCIRIA